MDAAATRLQVEEEKEDEIKQLFPQGFYLGKRHIMEHFYGLSQLAMTGGTG